MARRRLTLFFLLCCCMVTAQNNFEKGVVVDSVAVQNSQGETFAIYLPKSFIPEKASPILFIFEPAARGKIGISPFIESSEKYGLILICSNNSRNGSYEKSFAVAQNLFSHVLNNFKVDSAKMFLSGFSGGSRLAAAIATLTNQFAGVIGCGAGFSGNPSHTPSLEKFLYVGICGNEDMNYQEMRNINGYLKRFGFTNTLITFNGGHQWPQRTEINKAVDWLFLQLGETGDNSLLHPSVQQQFEEDFMLAKKYGDEGEFLMAAEHYERILSSYPTSVNLNAVRDTYTMLKETKGFKSETKALTEALAHEQKNKKRLFERLTADLKTPKKANWKWWNKEIKKLNAIETGGNKQMMKMVARVKNALVASVYEMRITAPELVKDGYLSFLEKFRNRIYSEHSIE